MLPRRHRLPLRTTRAQVEAAAKPFSSSLFTFLVAASPQAHLPSRFAIILSKKISKSAVTRNLLRRRTLAAVSEFLPLIKTGFNVLILTKTTLASADYPQIKADVEGLLRKSGLLPEGLPLKGGL